MHVFCHVCATFLTPHIPLECQNLCPDTLEDRVVAKMQLGDVKQTKKNTQMRDIIDICFFRRGEKNLFKELRLLLEELRAGRIQGDWMSGIQPDYHQATKGNERHSRMGAQLSPNVRYLVLLVARVDYQGAFMGAFVDFLRKAMFVGCLFFWGNASGFTCSPLNTMNMVNYWTGLMVSPFLLFASLRLMFTADGEVWKALFVKEFRMVRDDNGKVNMKNLYQVNFLFFYEIGA